VEKESAGIPHRLVKLRAFALTAALLGCTYVPLACFAGDDKTNRQPSPQNTPAATAPVELEGTKVAHDGSINDIPVRNYLTAILHGLADVTIQRLPALTPSAFQTTVTSPV
jgi:hypothetical protein